MEVRGEQCVEGTVEVRGEKQCVGDEKEISSNLEGKEEEEQVEVEIFTHEMLK